MFSYHLYMYIYLMIKNNHQINKAIHLFEKIEDEKIKEQLEKLNL